jgi:hypothetical protein
MGSLRPMTSSEYFFLKTKSVNGVFETNDNFRISTTCKNKKTKK